jgi:RNA polymerase sigma factor (sigma-70 family)
MVPTTFEPEQFEKLLTWLNDDREAAGLKYQAIRERLVKIFHARGCHQADELADETIDRVAKKIDTIFDSYQGDPALYFYAVAKNVFLESVRAPKSTELTDNISVVESPEKDEDSETEDQHYGCLDECLAELTPEQREFILGYYTDNKGAKVERRKKIATDLGISNKALRIRAFRIRESLRKCITKCMKKNRPE